MTTNYQEEEPRMETLGMIFSNTLRVYQRHHHMIFSSLGLHRGQQRLFFTLYRENALTQIELANRMKISAPTLTRMIQNLEKKGFVARRKDRTDLRRTIVYLTGKGKERHDIIAQKLHLEDEKIFQTFSTEDKDLLKKYLFRIQDQLHKNTDIDVKEGDRTDETHA